MNRHDSLTKGLVLFGTVLVGFPVVAPLLFAVVALFTRGRFLLDYLMPAELGLMVLAGWALLMWAAFRVNAYKKLFGFTMLAAVVLVVGAQAFAVVTGLASGDTAPEGWTWLVVMLGIWAYNICVVILGVGGVLLARKVFGQNG